MKTVETVGAENGVTLVRAIDRGVTVYVVTCSRVPGMQAFHSLEQAIEVYGMELLKTSRYMNNTPKNDENIHIKQPSS